MKRLEGMSAKILDASSSPVRLTIIKLLSRKGPLPYTEIMFAVNFDPVRDAGKFVYHLKSLIDAGLLKLNRKTKKYSLTELGEIVVKFSRDLEEYLAVKKGRLFVRTSQLTIEEFDRSKIVNSLVREAEAPLELAQEIAAEAEERLINLKTRYLTSPLVREFINSLLLEKGLEEYRHRLTRLGMPVYDVSQVIKETGKKGLPVSVVENAAKSSVLKEYVLLKGVPRDVADAHLSGLIHLDTTEGWLLKPDSASHDLKSFISLSKSIQKIPENLYFALTLIERIHSQSLNEVSIGETFPFFNVFLAPFIPGNDLTLVEKLLERFLEALNREYLLNPFTPRLSLGLSLKVPKELGKEEALDPKKGENVYSDFQDEASLVTTLLLKSFYRISRRMPILNPMLVVKLDDTDEEILENIYTLEASHGSIYLDFTKDTEAIYFGDGIRLSTEWSGDWHADIVRTGQAGTVFLNLARIAFDSRGNFERFRKQSYDAVQLAVEALKTKRDALIEQLRVGLLPILKRLNFSIENAQYGIGILGLSEAASFHVGSPMDLSSKALDFSLTILKYLNEVTSELSKELDMRINLLQKPCEDGSSRLAKQDLVSLGKSALKFQGLTNNPYYTDIPLIPSNLDVPLEDRIEIEGKLQHYLTGGHLCLFHMSDASSHALRELSDRFENNGIHFATYSRDLSHCRNCMTLIQGLVQSCPSCGSSSIQHYGTASALLKPLTLWPTSRIREMEDWVRYSIK